MVVFHVFQLRVRENFHTLHYTGEISVSFQLKCFPLQGKATVLLLEVCWTSCCRFCCLQFLFLLFLLGFEMNQSRQNDLINSSHQEEPIHFSGSLAWYHISIWGWILIFIPILGFIAICFTLLAWKLTSSLSRANNSEADPKIKCPLCVKKVKTIKWSNGQHREKCARKYEAKMQLEWPIFDPSVACPVCSRILRKIGGTSSRLLSCHQNCVPNFISCFHCDFHLCQQQLTQQRNSNFLAPKSYDDALPSYQQAICMAKVKRSINEKL